MSYENLKKAALAVEENNRMNGGSWSDWRDADHIIDAYKIGELTDSEKAILNRAIESNGKTLDEDMNAADEAGFFISESGISPNFWRHVNRNNRAKK